MVESNLKLGLFDIKTCALCPKALRKSLLKTLEMTSSENNLPGGIWGALLAI